MEGGMVDMADMVDVVVMDMVVVDVEKSVVI